MALYQIVPDPFKVNLDLIHGTKNTFYFALRDESAASDSLHVIKFALTKEEKEGKESSNEETDDGDSYLTHYIYSVSYPGTGEILALESNPL